MARIASHEEWRRFAIGYFPQTGGHPYIVRGQQQTPPWDMALNDDITRSRTESPTQNASAGDCAKVRKPFECGALPFLIKRDGVWMYKGSPIRRKELVCLFASVLKRDEDGGFWLETPAERGTIEVEDAPFLAVELEWTGVGRDQVLTFRTNVDQLITAGPDHPIRISHDILTCEPTPYLLVRPGLGRLPVEARICRAVYYELVALAETEIVHGRTMVGVWSENKFFPLGEMPCLNDNGECSEDCDC